MPTMMLIISTSIITKGFMLMMRQVRNILVLLLELILNQGTCAKEFTRSLRRENLLNLNFTDNVCWLMELDLH